MAVYNEPLNWVLQAIRSILYQTFTDFEFIIINDNPTREELWKLLEELSNSDSRIIIRKNKVNIGLTKSLNEGLKICKGKYIARMDADDISFPDRLAHQYNYLEKNPEISVLGTNRKYIDENSNVLKKKHPLIHNPNTIESLFILRSPFIHPSVMFRRSLIDNGFFYDESFTSAQDYNLWGRLLINNYRLDNLKEPLLFYRISSNQITNKKNEDQLKNAIRIKRMFADYLNIDLNNTDFDLLVLPFSNEKSISPVDVKNLSKVLLKISKQIEKFVWYNKTSFNAESFRLILMTALRSSNKVISLSNLVKSPFFSLKNILKQSKLILAKLF
ncbi:MAG: glycosyltransferase [Muribaculaceae bacterium]|nr:glycosyltransferase [Muribaculaceae bacterium]